MIALLEGSIVEKTADTVIISCGGVGYGAWVTVEDYGRLNKGDFAKIYIYEHIREQSHDLFGFVDKETKQLFELLLSVNGVGPKMALAVLSVAPVHEVRSSIANGSVATLKAAKGVGKRVAERIIVDLKEKVGFVSSDESGLESFMQQNAITNDEACDALVALGFSTLDAQRVLKDVDTDLPVEERIKMALQNGISR